MKCGLVIGVVLLLASPAVAAPTRPATVKVSGYGLLGNRELRQLLELVQPAQRPEFYDANFVEDAALVLLSRAVRDGYLNVHVTARLTLADGSELRHTWDKGLATFLPRPLAVKRVHFIIQRGPLFHYRQLQISGLKAISVTQARQFFVNTDFLLPLKAARVFTPARLDQSVASLTEALQRLGYADATVRATVTNRNERAGSVDVGVAVSEGKRVIVRSVRVEIIGPGNETPEQVEMLEPGKPYSRPWQEDLAQKWRAEQFQRGYPDTTAEPNVIAREEQADSVQLDMRLRVRTGQRVTLDDVRFVGNQRTRDSLLERRVRLAEDAPLNRIEVERGRYRLSRLGIFERVGVRYDPTTGPERDVIYEVKEGKRMELSLLAGYGSYEMLRGGLEWHQNNLWGRAHSGRVRAVQSFKSTSSDLLYTMPELIGEDVTVYGNASLLFREEVSFTREEYSASLGAQRRLTGINSDVGLRYSYQLLTASDVEVVPDTLRQARVGAFSFDFKHDERNDPLLPRNGYKVFANLELASTTLGGEVDYQRLTVSSSLHFRVGGGRFLHLGIEHGVAATFGGESREVPFNRRFFPGGENSVRGYQDGEAAPRDAEGRVVGAATYTQGNVEFEQMLTPAWSLVAFVDGVAFTRELGNFPGDEFLCSVGAGIRFKTIIGPARLEYGHNLNPRAQDPDGTLHFSLGFPF